MKSSTVFFCLLAFAFLQGIPGRELSGPPYTLLFDIAIILTFIGVLIGAPKENWQHGLSDLIYIVVVWFIISVIEVINPGANVLGWLAEIKSAALYPLVIVITGTLVLRTNRQLDIFLILIIATSTLGALNGIKQLYIRPSRGEQFFLDSGGAITHVLWGKLRVFSFYSEAAQFGASQAAVGLTTLVLGTMGVYKKKWKKYLLIGCSLLMLYGMLISGTRGALFALVVGGFIAIALSKKFKVLLIGGCLACGLLGFLKFTHIGNGNYQIYRLRSAVNPEDPSLNVRFNTQRVLREYMSSKPFGGGLGVIGGNAMRFNPSNFLAKIQPDSYYVKVWAMYGIVGFTIWICMMVYILGKCCGICWKIEDQALRVKMIAITAGYAGILFCSYANEVINTMPSSFVVYFSWVFIFISPRLETTEKSNLLT